MGLTRQQYVNKLCHEVAWLHWRDRLRVLRALAFTKATNQHGTRLYKD